MQGERQQRGQLEQQVDAQEAARRALEHVLEGERAQRHHRGHGERDGAPIYILWCTNKWFTIKWCAIILYPIIYSTPLNGAPVYTAHH